MTYNSIFKFFTMFMALMMAGLAQAQDAMPAPLDQSAYYGLGYRLPKWRNPAHNINLELDVLRNNIMSGGSVGLVWDAAAQPAWLGYASSVRGVASEFLLNTALSTGMMGSNGRASTDFRRARPGATENYIMLRGGVHFLQAFRNDWQGRVALSGQYADALVPGPSGLSGVEAVRGYLSRDVADDRSYVSQLELYTPDFATALGMGDKWRSRIVGFYDFGEVWRNNGLPGGDRGSTVLASTGLGLRLAYGRSVSLRFDLAQPLRAYNAQQFDNQRLNAGVLISY